MTAEPVALFENMLTAIASRLLALDAETSAHLTRLNDRAIALCVRDRDWKIFAVVSDSKVTFSRNFAGDVDVSMLGQLTDYIALVKANKGGESLAAGRIEITGDLAVAQDVQAVLDGLELDFDEMLSRFVGDVMAHQIGRVVRGAGRSAKGALGKCESDLGDYLAHELRAVPVREDVEALRRSILVLTEDVDRAQARLRKLLSKVPDS
jgi:ubiquinone biosynthesis protein UbiJ